MIARKITLRCALLALVGGAACDASSNTKPETPSTAAVTSDREREGVSLVLQDSERFVTVGGTLALPALGVEDVRWAVDEGLGRVEGAVFTAPEKPGDVAIRGASARAAEASVSLLVHVVARAAAPPLSVPSVVTVGRSVTVRAALGEGETCAWEAENARKLTGEGTAALVLEPSAEGDVRIACTPSNAAGEAGPTSNVTARAVTRPTIATFTTASRGGLAFAPVALRFETAGGTGVVTPGDLAVEGSGSVFVTPGAPTTYTLRLTGADGEVVSRTAFVDVTPSGGQLVVKLAGEIPASPDVAVTTPDGRLLHPDGAATFDAIPVGTYAVVAANVDVFGARLVATVDDSSPVVAPSATKIVTITYARTDLAPALARVEDDVTWAGAPPKTPRLVVSDPTNAATIRLVSLTPEIVLIDALGAYSAGTKRGHGYVRADIVNPLGMTASRVFRVDVGDVGVTNPSDLGAGSLREAVTTAPRGATIVFDRAAWGTIPLASPLPLANGQKVLGPGATRLVLDGGNRTRQLVVDTVDGVDPNATIEGLTLANGNGEGRVPGLGGAIFVRGPGSSVTLRDVEVVGNSASRYGGAVHLDSASGTFERTTFTGNRSRTGGALSTFGAGTFATFTNATVEGNEAGYGGASFGAAALVFLHSTVTKNRATVANGGGLVMEGGSLSLQASVLAGNLVTGGADPTAPDLVGAVTTNEDSLVGGDPMLAPIALGPGGTTRSCAPLPGSPALGLVPRTRVLVSADQNGKARTAGASAAGAVEP